MAAGSASATYTIEEALGGFALLLDGKALSTPAGLPLIVPTRPLAEVIVAEKPGHRQANTKSTPLLRMAVTAIDVVAKTRGEIVDRLMAYAGSDLLCHRADQPPALVQEQSEIWQPLLDWCAKELSAPLRTSIGIMPVAQPDESIAALRRIVEGLDVYRLEGLSAAVAVSGSLVLGLALSRGHISGTQACDAAELDAGHQMKDWGDDPDVQVRIAGVREELKLCERYFKLLTANGRGAQI